MSEFQAPAPRPCGSCPYRQDVPAGVWAPEEYAKLPDYDAPTGEQPAGVFLCHQQNGRVCGGWAACHGAQGRADHSRDSLALRMAGFMGSMSAEDIEATRDYVSPVPLWASGQEAFTRGMAGVADPSPEAEEVMAKLGRRKKPFGRKDLEELEARTGRQIDSVEDAIKAMNDDLETIRENLIERPTEEG